MRDEAGSIVRFPLQIIGINIRIASGLNCCEARR
jgi:hypothetical protein